MRLINFIERAFKTFLPTPFTIALLLTLFTFLLALFFTESVHSGAARIIELAGFWEKGLWNSNLLVFAVQMMLMLVLGHALALSAPVNRLISHVTRFCTDTPRAALIVTLLTITVALFNWGLGLVFGAILARKVGENALKNSYPLNYPLIGAAGYSGLMVWHGGISGSAPIKVAESGHLKELMGSNASETLPDVITLDQTIFGAMNLTGCLLILLLLPIFMFFLGKMMPGTLVHETDFPKELSKQHDEQLTGIGKLDGSQLFSAAIALLILCYLTYKTLTGIQQSGFAFITPNYLNLLLLGLCLLLHRSIRSFLSAVDEAIGGSSGILIQFPLYFGIIGIMTHSGLVHQISDFFISISNEHTFPLFTFFSAGLVNIFIPSGGGQWAVQGPIVIQSAVELGIPLQKIIMALAYGDQLTNMLQPFWALPLLGITGLKAQKILPYSFALMIVGTVIYTFILLVF